MLHIVKNLAGLADPGNLTSAFASVRLDPQGERDVAMVSQNHYASVASFFGLQNAFHTFARDAVARTRAYPQVNTDSYQPKWHHQNAGYEWYELCGKSTGGSADSAFVVERFFDAPYDSPEFEKGEVQREEVGTFDSAEDALEFMDGKEKEAAARSAERHRDYKPVTPHNHFTRSHP